MMMHLRIRSALNPGYCVDLHSAEVVRGQPIIAWSCHSGRNQRWQRDMVPLNLMVREVKQPTIKPVIIEKPIIEKPIKPKVEICIKYPPKKPVIPKP